MARNRPSATARAKRPGRRRRRLRARRRPRPALGSGRRRRRPGTPSAGRRDRRSARQGLRAGLRPDGSGFRPPAPAGARGCGPTGTRAGSPPPRRRSARSRAGCAASADRHQAALPGDAEQHRVHRLGIAEQGFRQPHARAGRCRRGIGGALDGAPVQPRIDRQPRVALERRGGGEVEVADHRGSPARSAPARRARQPTARSAASIRSAVAERDAHHVQIRRGRRPICTCATTAPFFCASPVKSSVLTLRGLPDAPPSPGSRRRSRCRRRRCRRTAPRHGVVAGKTGCGSAAANAASRAAQCGSAAGARGRRRRSVTKLGQKPFRQDRSTLHAVGLMRRLRPSAVSTGSIAMQPDWVEQSPQFSQTSVVDDDAACRLRQLAALAPAALFGGADLVVDQHRDAFRRAQFALHGVEFAARVAASCRAAARSLAAGGRPRRRRSRCAARPRRRPGRRCAAR